MNEIGQMSGKEFSDWQAYDMLSPLGIERIEYMLALVCVVITNSLTNAKMSVKDFLPDYSAPFRPVDKDAVAEKVKAVFGALTTKEAD